MLIKKKKSFTFISSIAVILFTINACCYGLAPIPASHNPATKRLILASLTQNIVRYAYSPAEIQLLENNNTQCILLSSGDYLVTEKVADNDIGLLMSIYHSEIKAMMQILKKDKPERYERILRAVLENFPYDEEGNASDELYLEHLVARAFQWLLLENDGLITERDVPIDERTFITHIKPAIMSENDIFKEEGFWDSYDKKEAIKYQGSRRSRIRKALNNGMRFYQVSGDERSSFFQDNIIDLSEVKKHMPVGKKAKSFMRFQALGLPYPEGVVLTTVLSKLIAENNSAVLDVVVDMLIELLEINDENRVSLRSSPESSMPGMLKTFLDIHQREDLRAAIKEIAEEWNSETVSEMKSLENIPPEQGQGIIVQKMVYGDKNENSASGVVFSRDQTTGDDGLYGSFIVRSKGDEIVSGRKVGEDIRNMEKLFPVQYRVLAEEIRRLEKICRYPQEVEFTIEDGKLYFLQTRDARFVLQTEIEILPRLRDEGLINNAQLALRMEAIYERDSAFRALYKARTDIEIQEICTGTSSTRGAMVGRVIFDIGKHLKECKGRPRLLDKPVIYIADKKLKGDELVQLLKIYKVGLITLFGDKTSHEAVLTGGAGIPAIFNAQGVKIEDGIFHYGDGGKIKEGDIIVVDADANRVFFTEKTIDHRGDVNRRFIPESSENPEGEILRRIGHVGDFTGLRNLASHRSSFLERFLDSDDPSKIKEEYTYERLFELFVEKFKQWNEMDMDGREGSAIKASIEKNVIHELLMRVCTASDPETKINNDFIAAVKTPEKISVAIFPHDEKTENVKTKSGADGCEISFGVTYEYVFYDFDDATRYRFELMFSDIKEDIVFKQDDSILLGAYEEILKAVQDFCEEKGEDCEASPSPLKEYHNGAFHDGCSGSGIRKVTVTVPLALREQLIEVMYSSFEWVFFKRLAEKMRSEAEKSGKKSGQVVNIDADQLIVVGDLHSDIDALESIVADIRSKKFLKQKTTKVVLLGDYLTAMNPRDFKAYYGEDEHEKKYKTTYANDLERRYKLLLKIAQLKKKYPDQFYVLPGNSEIGIKGKYLGKELFDWMEERHKKLPGAVKEFIDSMPLFAVVNVKGNDKPYLISHGGVLKPNLDVNMLIAHPRHGVDNTTDEDEFKQYCYSEIVQKYSGGNAFIAQIFGHIHLFGAKGQQQDLKELGIRADDEKILFGEVGNFPFYIVNSYRSGQGAFTYLRVTKEDGVVAEVCYPEASEEETEGMCVGEDVTITGLAEGDRDTYQSEGSGSNIDSGAQNTYAATESFPGTDSDTKRIYDVGEFTALWLDILNRQIDRNNTYTIRYDSSRLSWSQIEIIETYAKTLARETTNRVKVVGFKADKTAQQNLIHVSRENSSGKVMGEGQVGIDLPAGGGIEQYMIRIIGMVNMAFAASHVSDEESSDNRPILGFIRHQCRLIVGSDIDIPEDIKELITFIKNLPIPAAAKMPIEKIEEYNEFARKVLVSA